MGNICHTVFLKLSNFKPNSAFFLLCVLSRDVSSFEIFEINDKRFLLKTQTKTKKNSNYLGVPKLALATRRSRVRNALSNLARPPKQALALLRRKNSNYLQMRVARFCLEKML